ADQKRGWKVPGGWRGVAAARQADSPPVSRQGCPPPAPFWSVPRRTAGSRRSWRRSASSLRRAARARRSPARPCFQRRRGRVDRASRHRRWGDQSSLELRSEGEQCKDRQLAHPLDSQIEKFEGGGIRPVRILEREQDRLPAGETLELIEQCHERPAALLRGAEGQQRIALAERDRQQRRKNRRYGLNLRCARGEERFQLVEALL